MSAKPRGETLFTPDTFRFLKELAKNNNRAWFDAHKARYETVVRDPSFAFVRVAGPKLSSISPHLVGDDRPVGGSVRRIYRDIRFSKDKTPYRTSVGIEFKHDATVRSDDRLPGFFLHLAPGDSRVYAGMWQPEPPRLARIRNAIVKHPSDWKKVRAMVPDIEGESLKRPPPGFPADSPWIEDIKRKGFMAGLGIPDRAVLRSGFPNEFVKLCTTLDPLNRFLARALDAEY